MPQCSTNPGTFLEPGDWVCIREIENNITPCHLTAFIIKFILPPNLLPIIVKCAKRRKARFYIF